MSSEPPDGFKRNPGYCPEEAEGKRVRVILGHSGDEPHYDDNPMSAPGWPASGKGRCRWSKPGRPVRHFVLSGHRRMNMALAVEAWRRALAYQQARARELADPARELCSWEIAAAKTAHRRVPIGGGGGQCRWCEMPILGKRGKYIGKPDPARSWCRDDAGRSECVRQFNLHSRAEFQFNWLVGEYGEKCAGCGVNKPQRETSDRYGVFRHSESDLAVDHIEPLWLVALTVPIEDRRPYFGPTNLQLLCTPCHNRKSKREAGLRALMKRQLVLAL